MGLGTSSCQGAAAVWPRDPHPPPPRRQLDAVRLAGGGGDDGAGSSRVAGAAAAAGILRLDHLGCRRFMMRMRWSWRSAAR